MTNPISRLYKWAWYRENCAQQRRYSKIATTFGAIGMIGILASGGEVNPFGYIGLLGMFLFVSIEIIFGVFPVIAAALYGISIGIRVGLSRLLGFATGLRTPEQDG